MTPNIFVRIGDTDCWDYSTAPQAGASFLLGRDLRTLSGSGYTTVNSVCSILSRLAVEPTSLKRRAEWLVINSPGTGAQQFGIFDDAETFNSAASAASQAGATTHSRGGGINSGGVNLTIVDAWAIGDVIGLDLWRDGDSDYVQFLKNGNPEYDPIEITFGRRWRLVGCLQYLTGHVAMLLVDRDDLRFPGDSMPWGAAARVSDIGGYSTPATAVAAADASITVAPDGRTFIGSADTRLARVEATRRTATGLIYVEAVPEVSAANGGMLGLVPADCVTNTWPGSATSDGYGIVRRPGGSFDGEIYFDGSTVSDLGSFAASDVPGFVWNPAEGKLWWTKNGIPFSGDPEAGTGAHHTGVADGLVPAVAPYNGGRWRLALHRLDQQHRPTYASSWDGPDILPEQHHRSRIASDTEITQELWFQPWGGSRKSGSPIGTIELHNQDGRYDPLRSWELRDQQIAIYERIEDGTIEPLARALVDNVKRDGLRKVRIMSRGMDALLDVRVDNETFLTGTVAYAPVTPVSGLSLGYNLAQDPLLDYSILDQGVDVTSYRRAELSDTVGMVRTVNPAGKQVAAGMTLSVEDSVSDLPNDDFSSWSGDDPTSWTVSENGTTSKVTQSGSAARFIRDVGAPACSIAQTWSSSYGSPEFFRIVVSAYTSGDLTVNVTGIGTQTRQVGITKAGTYIVDGLTLINGWSFHIDADEDTDLTIDSIECINASQTSTPPLSVAQIIGSILDYQAGSIPSANRQLVGLWTNQRPVRRQMLVDLDRSILIDYYSDPEGVLTFSPWPVVVGVTAGFDEHTPTATLGDSQRVGALSISDDLAPGLSDQHAVARNYAPHSESELAGSVSASDRVLLTTPYKTNRLDLDSAVGDTSTKAEALHPFCAHAIGAPPVQTYNTSGSSLSNEPNVDNDGDYFLWALHRVYAERRRFFSGKWSVSKYRNVELGDMVSIESSEVAGLPVDPVKVVKKTRRLLSPTIEFKLWG